MLYNHNCNGVQYFDVGFYKLLLLGLHGCLHTLDLIIRLLILLELMCRLLTPYTMKMLQILSLYIFLITQIIILQIYSTVCQRFIILVKKRLFSKNHDLNIRTYAFVYFHYTVMNRANVKFLYIS